MVSRQRGVTLIELLLVLLLAGVLLSIGMPRLDQLLTQKALEKDARQMAWTLRTARQTAISSGAPQMVIFRPSTDRYRYQGKTTSLSQGIHYMGNTTFHNDYETHIISCQFNSSGLPLPRGGTATLQDDHGHKLYVIVNSVEGRVRVSDQPPQF